MIAEEAVTRENRMQRPALWVLFLVGALAIFMLGSPYFSLFPTNRNDTYNAVLAGVFFVATIAVYRNAGTRRYWQAAFAFFAGACANWALGLDLVHFPGDSADTVSGVTWNKLAQFVEVVVPVLLLVKAAGDDLGSLYLTRGRVRVWLPIGLGSLIAFGVLGLVMGAAQGKTLDAMLAALPLWLAFSLLNGFMEELWFRGIFLPRLSPILGGGASVLLITIAFTSTHMGATYVAPAEILQFLVPVFLVGLGAGYLAIRTGSLWGAVLLHAGADLFYALAFTFL